jgi:glycosyltransferase involved in cell wall biosynthesis
MKILWMHSHFFHWMGGTVFIYELLKKIRKDCLVEIVVQNGNANVIKKFTDGGYTVHNLKSPSTNSRLFWLGFFKNCNDDAAKVQKIIDLNDFDTLITSMFPANFIAKKLKNINTYQYCYEPYATFWDPIHVKNLTFFKRYIAYILKLLFARYDILAVRNALKVFALSPETKQSIDTTYNVKSFVTYLGVDLNFYRHLKNESISKEFKENQVLLHNTDFSPPKGTGFLLDCMPEIVSNIPNIKLLITCSLNSPKEIKKLSYKIEQKGLSKNVSVLGWVEYELLPCYYSLADLIIYPGTSDGGGASAVSLFVLEAMACGTPCLRSNDSKTEVLDGVNGELFNPLDHNEFINKCITLLNDQELLNLYSSRCRTYVEGKYSWESAAKIVLHNLKN